MLSKIDIVVIFIVDYIIGYKAHSVVIFATTKESNFYTSLIILLKLVNVDYSLSILVFLF